MTENDLLAQLPELQEKLNDIVRQAGAIALDYRNRSLNVWHKQRGEPVSDADIAVDRFLLGELSGLLPDCALISEESYSPTAAQDFAWVIDPIDGTRAFIRGDDDFAVSVGLIEDGRPILASLFAPATDRHFSAIVAQGSYLNGEPLRVTDRKELAGARFVANQHLFREGGPTRGPWPDMSFVRINSFALRIAEVACGAADAVLTLKAKADWDMAAADLILREAGGAISGNNMTLPRYGSGGCHVPVIAATPALMPQIKDRL